MIRPGRVAAPIALAVVALTTLARAGDRPDPLLEVGVVFARDGALWRTDARGHGPPTLVAAVPAGAGDVRALRTDAAGKVLLADLGGAWYWLALADATATLAPLACGPGPATLIPDGTCAVCADARGMVAIIQLASGKRVTRPVPAAGATIVGTGTERRLIWNDHGIWAAPVAAVNQRQALAPESPLRSLSIAPDGARALGVYAGTVHIRGKPQVEEPAELLFEFALDGTAARRKSIRSGVPVLWSHDSQWVLVQDGSRACVMRAVGGQYKCWKGYTAVSIAPDGAWALVLGTRRGESSKPTAPARPPAPGASAEGEAGGDERVEADIPVPLPSGPLSLYRVELAGAQTSPPSLVERAVDGAAVWLP